MNSTRSINIAKLKMLQYRLLYFFMWLVFFSLLAIPRLPGVAVKIALEDLLYPFYGIITLFLFIERRRELLKFLSMPATYFLYSLIVTIVGMFDPRFINKYAMVYFKELEYVVIAIAVYLLMDLYGDRLLKHISRLFVLNIAVGLFQISINYRAFYGIRCISTDSPALVGATYFFGCVWFTMMYFFVKKSAWNVFMCIASLVCVIASVSRTSIGAVGVFLMIIGTYWFVLDVLIPFITKMRIKSFYLGLSLLLLVMSLVFISTSSYQYYSKKVEARLIGKLGEGQNTRSTAWERFMDKVPKDKRFLGGGRGLGNSLKMNTWTLCIDSQYVRNVAEIGYVGSIIFLAMLFLLSVFFVGDGLVMLMYVSLVAAMLVMMYPVEAMQTTRSGTFFWVTVLLLYYFKKIRGETEVSCS
jgi:hypothetical protein